MNRYWATRQQGEVSGEVGEAQHSSEVQQSKAANPSEGRNWDILTNRIVQKIKRSWDFVLLRSGVLAALYAAILFKFLNTRLNIPTGVWTEL